MFGWFSDARTSASRWIPGEAVWIRREEIRQDFQCDIAVELGVAGAVDLTHATFTDLGGVFIHAEASAWAEGHGCGSVSLWR